MTHKKLSLLFFHSNKLKEFWNPISQLFGKRFGQQNCLSQGNKLCVGRLGHLWIYVEQQDNCVITWLSNRVLERKPALVSRYNLVEFTKIFSLCHENSSIEIKALNSIPWFIPCCQNGTDSWRNEKLASCKTRKKGEKLWHVGSPPQYILYSLGQCT